METITSNIVQYAEKVFEIEAKAIADLKKNLTEDFEKAVKEILAGDGKLVISGMGKSGIIGKKIAATLASTGTPSFFMHPGEAFHGDLGMVTPEDVVIVISNSGETNEMLNIIPFFKDNGNTLIAMTGNPESTLAKNSNYHLNIAVEEEACPLSLAPTSSTTATLVMGDALAVALMYERGFKAENFARFHPGGSLGKRLLTNASTLMKSENLPIISKEDNTKTIIAKITEGRLGLAIVMQEESIAGIITDGDIRRAMESKEENFFQLTAEELMTPNPKTIASQAKIAEAEELMNHYKINSLLVAEDNKLLGVLQIYDINV
ncbi:KpsF/GutQ family sugar-phosphate isomerase [Aureibacter tunicatorum]|uniref:Arabinose-5-phosphate isomerase n=1 Tax=Aureibacter tunicatorum TaxID=866807 RepID=A0AAE3XR87_9BACT|nr:KpsF/GutQ family sugar-phosphate isomerase [Aureibacter tunicatorum]MDR6240421.1 arabinose-5-phosphate isomerase [Aureibacter tunicatorum]BDD05700.1 arabinose-5-phosphate isomerase [Aureibacter tunicatorum]